jgi:hypothetical protein
VSSDRFALALVPLALGLASCALVMSFGDHTAGYRIRGTVDGLERADGTVTLLLNGGDPLEVAGDGMFAFVVPDGTRYVVTVQKDPPGHVCTVVGGAGTIDAADATVVVHCPGTNPTTADAASDVPVTPRCGADAEAGAVELVPSAGGVLAIAVDANHAYFLAEGLGIRRVPKAGGFVQPIVSTEIPDPTLGLGIDDTSLYAANWSGAGPGALRVNKDDGGTTALDTCNTGAAIVSDTTHAFWVTRTCAVEGRVRGALKSGVGGFTNISKAFDGSGLLPRQTGMIALDSTRVFWSVGANVFTLLRTDTEATPQGIGTFGTGVRGLAVDDLVYVLADDGLHAIKKTGGFPVWTDVTLAGTGVAGLTVRDGFVYAADRVNARIVRLKNDGTDRRTVAVGQDGPSAIAVDECFVYWSTSGSGGSVRRAPR